MNERKMIYLDDAIDALKALAVPRHLDSECEDIWERDRTLDNAIDVLRGLPPVQITEEAVKEYCRRHGIITFMTYAEFERRHNDNNN